MVYDDMEGGAISEGAFRESTLMSGFGRIIHSSFKKHSFSIGNFLFEDLNGFGSRIL